MKPHLPRILRILQLSMKPLKPPRNPPRYSSSTMAGILKKDITMVELRRKVGHEKGKSWTATLNEMMDATINLQNRHVGYKDLYATLLKVYGTQLGSMVEATTKLTRTLDGTIIEGWKNEKMCSNPRHHCNASSSETAKPTTNRVQGGFPAPTRRDMSRLPNHDEYEAFWAVDGPWTIDDALRTMEPAWVVWSQPSTRCHEAPMGSSQQG